MAIAASDIIAKVGYLLIDEGHVRWTVSELIGWINESAGAILTRRPAAFARRSVATLVAGTLQTIPADAAMLLDVTRNMKSDGTTPAGVIRRTDRQLLDDSDPDWHTSRQRTAVKHYTYDDRTPTIYYVYPPVTAGVKVEMMDAALPAAVADQNGSLAINPEYLEAVVNYVAYRCHTKDAEYANPTVAVAFFQAFENALGIKSQTQAMASPNQPTNSV